MGQVHAQDPVARADRAQVGGHVGLGAGVGLDVDVLGAREELEGTLLGEPLGDVDVLAAAVVALAGQALGVLVGEPAALRLEDGREDVVLAGDELDLVVLAAALADRSPPTARGRHRRSGPRRVPWERWRSSAVPRSASLGRASPGRASPSRRPGRARRSAAAGAHGPTDSAVPARPERSARISPRSACSIARLVEDRCEDVGRDRPGAQDPRRTARTVDDRRRDAASGGPAIEDDRQVRAVAELADHLGGRDRGRLARPVGR